MRLLILLLFAIVEYVRAQVDGFDTGRWNTEVLDVGTINAPLASLSPYHLYIRYPTTCNSQCGEFQTGGMPVLLFVTGFAGSLPASSYDVLFRGIARHGIIVVAVDQDLTGFALTLDISKMGVQLQKVVSYIKDPAAGLLHQIRNPGAGKTAFTNADGLLDDGAKIFFGGHSSGAHVALQNIVDVVHDSHVCPSEVAGFIMLSPLDGQDPLGFGGQFAIDDHHPVEFKTPGLIVAGQLDRVAADLVAGIPCVPDDRGNLHFYKGWAGFVQYIEASGMGVLDIMDESSSTAYDQFCAESNSTQGPARVAYRTMARGAVVSFIQGVVLEDGGEFLDKLENEDDLNYPVVALKRKSQGGATLGCTYAPYSPGLSYEVTTGLILFVVFFVITFVVGLFCFFRQMDADTLHRYHDAGDDRFDGTSSMQMKVESNWMPPPAQTAEFNSEAYSVGGSRKVSVDI